MKLIYCPACKDLFRLMKTFRFCKCKESWGRYKTDGRHAIIGGQAIPLGIDNASFKNAIKNRATYEIIQFDTFVIPFVCHTIKDNV